MRHINQHTCSRAVDFEVENGVVFTLDMPDGDMLPIYRRM